MSVRNASSLGLPFPLGAPRAATYFNKPAARESSCKSCSGLSSMTVIVEDLR